MKKLLLVSVIGLSSVLAASTCFAKGYISGNIGAVMVEDADLTGPALDASGLSGVEVSFDTGFAGALAAGADAGPVRIEGEFSYRINDMDEISGSFFGIPGSGPANGEIESMSLLGNVIFDIGTNSPFTPFIGAGMGFSNVDMEFEGVSEDDTVFAYQFIAGMGFKVSEVTSIDISYRYFATDDPELDGIESEYTTHNLFAGVRFSF
jgi:opacity protein-like surface antigen